MSRRWAFALVVVGWLGSGLWLTIEPEARPIVMGLTWGIAGVLVLRVVASAVAQARRELR